MNATYLRRGYTLELFIFQLTFISRRSKKIHLLETSAILRFTQFVPLSQKRDSTFDEITFKHFVTYRRTMTHSRPFHAQITAIKPFVKSKIQLFEHHSILCSKTEARVTQDCSCATLVDNYAEMYI